MGGTGGGTPGLPRCLYCGRTLTTERQIDFKYCSSSCKDRRRGDAPVSKVKKEADLLMRQFERGGLKLEEL